MQIQEWLIDNRATITTLVHPASVIGENVLIGKGTVVMAGCVINPDTTIGSGCIVNTSASIDHDGCIGDYVHVSVGAHLCGGVDVGKHTWIGAGATVSNNVKICGNCMIGTGAVVVKNIDEVGTYVGVPVRKINMKKICFVTTISATIKAFLIPFANYLYEKGKYDITFICNRDDDLNNILPSHIHYIPVNMKRGMSLSGLKSIIELKQIFEREKFDIVQYSTPNAAFYASIASKKAGIKNRVYCQWGIRYMGFEGISRSIFKLIEKVTCRNSTYIESESFNLYDFSLSEKLYTEEKACVVWNGSACGVDLMKFDITYKEAWRNEKRSEFKIAEDEIVFGYTGRITRDKGINELLGAFKELSEIYKIKLLLIGSIDGNGNLDKELFNWANSSDNVIWVEWTSETEKYYAALDVFVSPSYREGFGLVVIEAEAMGVPAIVSDVPGQSDAIVQEKTGLAVKVKNAECLANAMEELILNKEKREIYGQEARKMVEQKYEQQKLFSYIMEKRNSL